MNEKKTTIENDWQKKKKIVVKKVIFDEWKYRSPMAVTDIEKIIISSSVGGILAAEKTALESTRKIIEIIARQKPAITVAKKSIVNFKIREGSPIGYKATLRREKMWDFLFELININLPLINNFHGFSEKKFDNFGNINFGINDLTIFPLVPFELIYKKQGIQVNIVFKNEKKDENIRFLQLFNFPFQKKISV